MISSCEKLAGKKLKVIVDGEEASFVMKVLH